MALCGERGVVGEWLVGEERWFVVRFSNSWIERLPAFVLDYLRDGNCG